MYITAFDFG